MTWKDKLEIGLKEDAPFRIDNLPDVLDGGVKGLPRPGALRRYRSRAPIRQRQMPHLVVRRRFHERSQTRRMLRPIRAGVDP